MITSYSPSPPGVDENEKDAVDDGDRDKAMEVQTIICSLIKLRDDRVIHHHPSRLFW